ncbi:MAG: hydrogenase maturation nickel metallochaperone HypA [Eubacteriales bacterium]|nr:hydrogenase maturation nickel metallochaperone HypA [Eubacteriales bacterium]
MHELGIMIEVVRQVEAMAKREKVKRVEKIVLQIGEIATVIPHFVEECFPAAAYETSLEDTELEIEIIPANGRCRECEKVYHLLDKNGHCTYCGQKNFDFLSGREFMIKEILVEDEDEEVAGD